VLTGAPSRCARSRRAGRSVPFGAAGRGRSWRLLHREADALDAAALQRVHRLDDVLVADVAVGRDHDRGPVVTGLRFADAHGDVGDAQGRRVLAVDAHAQLLVDADDQLDQVRLGALLRLADARQVDDAGRDERRRHHEDDQQHEHDVDERDHVDLADRAAARAASLDEGGHGVYRGGGVAGMAPALRCRMFENSSMKLSSWIAMRSMSRAKRL
jgi:hypothetical protein